MVKFLQICTYLGAAIGAFSLVSDLSAAKSAPQQAAAAAVAIACAVIPYVISRTAQTWRDSERTADQLKRLVELEEMNQNRMRDMSN